MTKSKVAIAGCSVLGLLPLVKQEITDAIETSIAAPAARADQRLKDRRIELRELRIEFEIARSISQQGSTP